MRMDPPPSLAWAMGTIREATAADEPPLEPPVVRSGFQGFRARPEERGFGSRKYPQFRRIGLSYDDQPGALQPEHQFAVVVGNDIFQESRTHGHPHPAEGCPNIFHKEAHALGKARLGVLPAPRCGPPRTSE